MGIQYKCQIFLKSIKNALCFISFHHNNPKRLVKTDVLRLNHTRHIMLQPLCANY